MEIVIILTMLLIIVTVAALKLNDSGVAFPFKKKSNLFTEAEREFLKLLQSAVGQKYQIICRVRLSDIISVKTGTDKKTNATAIQRASGKQLDFVLCDKESLAPVVAVDLVHKNTKGGYKAQKDWFVTGALESASIPHLRIKVRSGYQPHSIRECIAAKLAPIHYKQPKVPLVKGTIPDTTRLSGTIAA
jgi:hypothetical protein